MNKFTHSQPEIIGILLTNLGTPAAATKKQVRIYLKEFLSDRRVIKMSKLLWWPLLNLFILNTRPKRSAAAYAKIWTQAGSPLLSIAQQQAQALQAAFDDAATSDATSDATASDAPVKVVLAMRYGRPSIKQGLAELNAAGARRILVFPLYPQYSATTTAATFDAVAQALSHENHLPELRFINHYHDQPVYIKALAASVRDHWQNQGRADKLLLSFHGIPQQYFSDGDPYYCECQKTGRLLAEELQLQPAEWALSFQSRLGPKQWLKPYTDITLQQLGASGVKTLDIICPGFSADCLETLEEIAIENKATFIAAGGVDYRYIACLNSTAAHIAALKTIAQTHLQGWNFTPTKDALQQRQARAKQLQQHDDA